MELTYYEQIAVNICGIEPDKLFEKTRKQDVILARNFCMAFRRQELGMTISMSAYRYHKDHATTIHAIKYLENLKFTKDKDYSLYQEFILQARKIKLLYDEYSSENLSIKFIHEKIAETGFKSYIKKASELFLKLSEKLKQDNNEIEVRNLLDETKNKLIELIQLYE